MVDIHTHILPGIDDGAIDWDDSLKMAEMSAKCGVDTLVCTPHTNIRGVYENYDSEQLSHLFEQFQKKLKQEGIPLQVLRGSEIFATLDMQGKIDTGKILPLNGTDYYLVEFDFGADPDLISEVLFGMQHFGCLPVLAHPERYDCVQDMPRLVFRWMDEGIYTQINRGSLLGSFGGRIERTAHELLSHNLVTCVASDAHKPYARTTFLKDVARMLYEEYSPEVTRTLLETNPRKLITGKRVSNHNIIPFPKKRWF